MISASEATQLFFEANGPKIDQLLNELDTAMRTTFSKGNSVCCFEVDETKYSSAIRDYAVKHMQYIGYDVDVVHKDAGAWWIDDPFSDFTSALVIKLK